ncbi:MAG: helix-turn-helix domain-containing protein [Proteobacteria bacterium]|nr:helix-turn-helix domain-containing protein [Pseudomonadota bacterium]
MIETNLPGAWLRQMRQDMGLSLRAFGRRLGYSKSFVHDWEANMARVPPRAVPKLARVLRRPIRQVWEATQPGSPLNQLIQVAGYDDEVSTRRLPVFDAGAGQPSSWTDGGYPVGEAARFESAPAQVGDQNAFFVRVHGDSMAPAIEDGDLALVEPGQSPQNGKVCFATFAGETGDRLVKRYRRKPDGAIHLISDNQGHPTIVLRPEEASEVRLYRVTWLSKRDP